MRSINQNMWKAVGYALLTARYFNSNSYLCKYRSVGDNPRKKCTYNRSDSYREW